MDQLKKRLKSFAWRLGAFAVLGVLGVITDSINDLGLPEIAVAILALILGEVTKYANNKLSAKVALTSIIFMLCMFVAFPAFAATKFAWDPPTTGGEPANYTLYFYDTAAPGTVYNYTVPATQTEILFTEINLDTQYGKTFEAYLKASNAAGESLEPSNTVSYEVPIYSPPANLIPEPGVATTGTSALSVQ
jgi:hypothetical protein